MARLNQLDALRAFAMLFNVPWHTAAIQARPEQFGVVLIDWLTTLSFRMELFFVLSGFFAAMLLQKRGPRLFIRQRLARIGIPLAVGLVTVAPATVLILFDDPSARDLLRPMHLWFLWYLLIFYAMALAVRWLGLRFKIERPNLGWLYGNRLLLLALGVAWGTAVLSLPNPPRTLALIGPSPPEFAHQLIFFTAGWFLYYEREHLASLGSNPWRWIGLAALASLVLVGIEPAWVGPGHDGTSGGAVGAHALRAFVAWSAIFGLLGLGERFFAKERPSIRYVADASYWIYLVHLPLVALAVEFTVSNDVPYFAGFFAVQTVVVGLALATYALFVRHTIIGRVLHGPRPGGRQRRSQDDALAASAHGG